MLENWVLVLIWIIVIAFVAMGGMRGLRRKSPAHQTREPAPQPAGAAPADAQPKQPSAPLAQPFNPIALAKQLEEPYGAVSHPADLLHLLLGCNVVFPEVGSLGLLLKLGEVLFALIQVKDNLVEQPAWLSVP